MRRPAQDKARRPETADSGRRRERLPPPRAKIIPAAHRVEREAHGRGSRFSTEVVTRGAPITPEAPVSITLKAHLDGHEVLVTLRGTDFASVKTQVEEAAAWPKTHAPAQPTGDGKDWCAIHQVAMRLNHGKDGRTWYSHRTDEGFCKGRVRR